MKNLRGLVLSGGESRRMGQDKGLMTRESVAWVNRAGTWLQRLGVPIGVMIREAQKAAYEEEVFPEFELITDHDLAVHGPLRGLLSFHRTYPDSDVLVLPCDMPALSAELLSGLVAFYQATPGKDAWVYEDRERVQPFPGIYASAHLVQIWQQLESGALPRASLMYVLSSGATARKPIADEEGVLFHNANSPDDL